MTFHVDLSPYVDEPEDTFREGEGTRAVTFTPRCTRINVGWLAADHPFDAGLPPAGFEEQLDRILHGQYVNAALGTHPCDLCDTANDTAPSAPRGSSEIRVPASPAEALRRCRAGVRRQLAQRTPGPPAPRRRPATRLRSRRLSRIP
ncbi:hypothetical protein [Streptomyces sp. NPDC088733]|uniref:DUF7919 family protein n=1 Tax=Streptomyces sp. NPDC088733 TaxID=3365880 RepID=UPI0038160105